MSFLGLVHTKEGYKDQDIENFLLKHVGKGVMILPVKSGYYHVENVPEHLLPRLKEMADCWLGQKVCKECHQPVENKGELAAYAKKKFPHLNP